MKNILALTLAIGAATAANAALVYDNLPATGAAYFSNSAFPTLVADDFDLGTATPNAPALITGLNLGFRARNATAFDLVIRFWSDLDFTATGNIFGSNPTPVASLVLGNVQPAAAGAYLTGMISLGSLSFVMPSISNYATSNHGISLEFLRPGTSTRNTDVTVLFQGVAPTVGTSEDVYWQDNNANGTLEGNEGVFFGGAANRQSNFAMQIEASPVPEPATLLILAAGIPALLRRRNKN